MLEKIKADLQQAQKDHNEIKISTLRLLLSEIHNAQIQKNEELTELEIISIIQREVKKRKEAVESFRAGVRLELAEKEESEAKILAEYLPVQLSDEELTKLVEDTITKVGASAVCDMGKVISGVMAQVAGRVDGARVAALVKEKLSQ